MDEQALSESFDNSLVVDDSSTADNSFAENQSYNTILPVQDIGRIVLYGDLGHREHLYPEIHSDEEGLVVRLQRLFTLTHSTTHEPTSIRRPDCRGGYFNLVLYVKIRSRSDRNTYNTFIVRLPQHTFFDTKRHALIHTAVAPHMPPKIVPLITKYDASTRNPMGRPYMMMNRLQGFNLRDLIHYITMTQRMALAKFVATIIARIHSIPVPNEIGPLDAAGRNFIVGKYDEKGEMSRERGSKSKPFVNIKDFLLSRFKTFDEMGEDGLPPFIWSNLIEATKKICEGLPAEVLHSKIVFFHRDFTPKNIIVKLGANGVYHINGVIDWDYSDAAPAAIAYTSPSWLWTTTAPADSDDDKAGDDSDPYKTTQDITYDRVKVDFFSAIDSELPGYRKIVSEVSKTHLKRLWRIARDGLHDKDDLKRAQVVLLEYGMSIDEEYLR